MASSEAPNYDFNHPLFKSKRNYLLYAKEHLDMWNLVQQTSVIDWEIKSTVSSLSIPTVYHVHYELKSITAINEDNQPIYGYFHTMELTIPTRYPLEPAQIRMLTDAWHPNIKSEGRFKGKICGNVDDFGIEYSLPQLVLRVGEILQYKNYLAEFIPPYPEDEKVAQWVREYAEPNDIVNKGKNIVVDDSPLIQLRNKRPPTDDGSDTGEPPIPPTNPPDISPQTPPAIRIKIKRKDNAFPQKTKRRIIIKGPKKKEDD